MKRLLTGWVFVLASLAAVAVLAQQPIAITQTNPAVVGGACTNQAVTAIAAGSGTPTCTTLTTAYLTTTGLGLTANPLSQFAATTSAQLAGVMSDEVGSGLLPFQSSACTWTPSDGSGAGLSLTVNSSACVTIGSLVEASADVTYPVTADGTAAKIAGLPATAIAGQMFGCPISEKSGAATLYSMVVTGSGTGAFLLTATAGSVTNAAMSTINVRFTCVYQR